MSVDTSLDLGEPLLLVADQRLQTREFGRTLISYQPVNVLRLGEAGAKLVSGWFSGSPVAENKRHRQLAHRLVAGGYAHYQPVSRQADPSASQARRPSDHARPMLTVVIPVRDDSEGLRATIEKLSADPPRGLAQIIIVDDGSKQPVTPGSLGLSQDQQRRVLIVHSGISEGPAAARNRGLASVTTPLVIFVDAGVVIGGAEIVQLTEAVRCPGVVAVAPRVRSAALPGAIARYERDSSPLDMGASPSVVAADHLLGYVPSACLVIRTAALRRINGFDPALRFGEDVDLVWRLAELGLVVYHPQAVATHPPRSDITSFIRQRFSYGTSAGTLAQRHPGRLASFSVSSWLASTLAVGGVLGPGFGAITTAALVGIRMRRISALLGSMNDPAAEAALLVGREAVGQLDGILSASRRPLSPILAAASIFGGPLAGPSRFLLGAATIRRAFGPKPDHGHGRATRTILGFVDDLAYSAGAITGSARAATSAPLRPILRLGTNRAADRY